MVLTETKTDTIHYFADENRKIHGEYKRWHNNGQLAMLCSYEHGKKYGEQKSWRSNGQLEEHCFYNHGKYNGEYKEWHDNGQLSEHCFFEHGKRHGEYKSWHESGILARHDFDYIDTDITTEVEALVQDINNIAEEERLFIKLTWGLECLPK